MKTYNYRNLQIYILNNCIFTKITRYIHKNGYSTNTHWWGLLGFRFEALLKLVEKRLWAL